ncbi:MAG: membrane dipeptidase [Archangium sp.]|nr:membrane dipeptidase [Archangium sp.]
MLLSFLLLVTAQLDPSQPVSQLGGDYWQGTAVKPGEVWGVADLHAHFFNHLGFGGRVLHGAPNAPGGMRQALRSCAANHGEAYGLSTAVLPEPAHPTSGYPTFEGWPRYDTLIHQQAWVDWIRRAWQGGLRLVQMDVQNTPYLGTLYRTANGLLVKGELTPVAVDDATALEVQVGAAKRFFNEGPGSDFAAIAYTAADARRIIASGKLAIVLGLEVESPGNFMHESQLGADPRSPVDALVKTLWEAGVRHVIPIHLQRNAFGHPAVFNPTLNGMNFAATRDFYATTDAFDGGVRFAPALASANPITGLVEVAGHFAGKRSFPQARAIAASEGLTDAGVLFVETLMRQGFVVDVEHMSELAVDQTLALAVKRNVPVISSHADFRELSFGTRVTWHDGGYTSEVNPLPFTEDSAQSYGTSEALKVRTERSRTPQQLALIRKLGGVVGVQLVSKGVGVSWRDRVPLDCDASSKGFLQLVAYGVEHLGGVAIASDVGGFATLPAPRFGTEACPGARGDAVRSANGRLRSQALAQRNGVQYQTKLTSIGPWRFPQKNGAPFTDEETRAWLTTALAVTSARTPATKAAAQRLVLERWTAMNEGPNAPLSRSLAGKREFDVNLDGVAHYGMIPDFFQDSTNVARAAGAPELIAPLFRSAEQYLQMWERLERSRK